MSLELNKLEHLVELAGGVKQARCPACAESGQDRKGEHLRIYPDGRFGCCVYPKDHEHRKRIFALAGERGRRTIQVRVADAKPSAPVQSGIFGRLGRVFESPSGEASVDTASDASDGLAQVQAETAETRTARTAVGDCGQIPFEYSRTPRTPSSLLTREAEHTVEPTDNKEPYKKLIESGEGVRGVRKEKGAFLAADGVRLPFLTADGTLSIPFDSPDRYHWWRGGQSVAETLNEVRAGLANKERINHAVTV